MSGTTLSLVEELPKQEYATPHRIHKLKNSAFIFIKPQANNESVQALVKSHLINEGMKITVEYDIQGSRIDRKKLIDQHYYSIASKATILKPEDMNVPEKKFEEFFDEKWRKVLEEERAANAIQACERFQCCSASELESAWRAAEEQNKVVKFGRGFYCGLLSVNDNPPLYVFNAFFMTMREKYVNSDATIHCYAVEWNVDKMSWKNFRENILGVTDPAQAVKGSIRRAVLDRYEELGLNTPPNKSDNGVHGSASAFEALAERVNWLDWKIIDDDYGKALLARGLTYPLLEDWFRNPPVEIPPSGEKVNLFDHLEDMDAEQCMEKLVDFYDFQLSLITGDGTACHCSVS